MVLGLVRHRTCFAEDELERHSNASSASSRRRNPGYQSGLALDDDARSEAGACPTSRCASLLARKCGAQRFMRLLVLDAPCVSGIEGG